MADAKAVLQRSSMVAVVGVSTHPDKPSHDIPRQLQQAGFEVIPVHPDAHEILGKKAYASLAEIPVPIDVVEVFRPPEEAPAIARQAVAVGAKTLWLQLGIRSREARAIAEAAGLGYVEDRCMGAERRGYGITKCGRTDPSGG